jgi:hypothetical protein
MDYRGSAPDSNLYGYGLVDLENLPTGSCTYPYAGTIRDILVYDNKELAWDGWRLFEPIEVGESGKCKVTTAYIPKLVSSAIAKTQRTPVSMCSAQTAKTRVVAVVEDDDGVHQAYAKLYNVATGTLKFVYHLNHGSNIPKFVRTVACGNFVHVLVADHSDQLVYCYTFGDHATDVTRITTVVSTNSGLMDTTPVFDVWKYDESKFLVAGFAAAITATWMNANGTVNDTTFSQNTTLEVDGSPVNFAICVHPVTNNIAVLYDDSEAQFYTVYDSYGTRLFTDVAVDDIEDASHLAIAPSYVDSKYTLYYGDPTTHSVYRVRYSMGTLIDSTVRYNVVLASKACRVGNVPFVWVTNYGTMDETLQTTYFLMNSDMYPVAKTEYGTAVINTTKQWLPSINCVVSADGTWNNTVFDGALLYKTRLVFDDDGTGDHTAYSDYAIKQYSLNFTPDKLSYDQAGKALYIAGGQLWSYDGETLREASAATGVEEFISFSKSAAAGGLTNAGVYTWRVDFCYKNAQNEECRAISFLSEAQTLGALENTVALTWRQPVTGVTDGYYLVFRNQSNGTVWYLVNNRVTDQIKYDATAETITYTDLISDAAILDNEQHPANSNPYVQPIAAPACEYVTYGQNRLWLAGGELAPGEVWPSRLFSPGQTPSFNWVLAFQADRTTESITGFAFQSNYGIVFKKNSTYVVTGDVSPNVYQNVAPNVQLALADRGCINFKSIGKLYNSIAFQSAAGYKVIDASGQMQDIGVPVETADGSCIGTLLVKSDEHLRFYQSDEPTLVFDYRDKLWTTFNFNTKPSAAALSNRTGYAVIARGNELLYEAVDQYRDGDFKFHYTIRTGPLAAKIGGFQRVRRVYCIGEKEGTPPPVTMRIYQDGHDWWTAQVSWDYTDNLNTSTIGDGLIGDNFIGDVGSSEFRDDIWKWRYRLESRKQKCENVAIELTDKGRLNENKWIPVAFAVEVGTKNGLDRLSARTISAE